MNFFATILALALAVLMVFGTQAVEARWGSGGRYYEAGGWAHGGWGHDAGVWGGRRDHGGGWYGRGGYWA